MSVATFHADGGFAYVESVAFQYWRLSEPLTPYTDVVVPPPGPPIMISASYGIRPVGVTWDPSTRKGEAGTEALGVVELNSTVSKTPAA